MLSASSAAATATVAPPPPPSPAAPRESGPPPADSAAAGRLSGVPPGTMGGVPPRSQYRNRLVWPDGVEFTDANDHNPLVSEACPACSGLGEREELVTLNAPGASQVIEWVTCPICGGSGNGSGLVRIYKNDSAAIQVEIGDDGWLTCPCCNWRFTIHDRKAWTGRRCKECGQRITPLKSDTYPRSM
jgi:hypothetical protein